MNCACANGEVLSNCGSRAPTNERCRFFSFPAFVRLPLEFSETNDKLLGHTTCSVASSKTSEAHERTLAMGVITINTVGVFSTARRKRNHHDEIMRRAVFAGTSPRLSAIKPNPPLCNKRSTALKARSRLWLQRNHNKRSKLMPALAADERSKLSLQSIKAQISSCRVARARLDSNKLVRPDDGAPWISVIAPRGKPLKNSSISAIPVGRTSSRCLSRRSKTSPKRLRNDDTLSVFIIAPFIVTDYDQPAKGF